MDPPAFVSEIGLTTDISLEGKSVPIIGVADLLVIDSKGNIQVIDYKTSPKTYSNYNSAKKRTFHY
jgi:RecB family exonuclease